MKFLKLQVENFMALASAEVELDQRGLVLIQGVNSGDSSAASNGAGKSTLMNSLMWCLYGETAHGVKGDDVLSTGHEKNCRVMVTVEDEGKRYAIIRHRKHKEFKNRLIVRGEDGDMTKGKDTLTQEFVERLIGASKEVFMASIYASREAMPDLPGMSDFLEKFNLLRLNQEEIEIMNNTITITEIEAVIKNLPKTKAQDQMASQENSVKHLEKS